MLRKRLKWILSARLHCAILKQKNYFFEHEVHKVEVMRNMSLTLGTKVGACLQFKLTDTRKEVHASFSAIGLAFDLKDSQVLKLGTMRATKGL